jgi:hypothetical protein
MVLKWRYFGLMETNSAPHNASGGYDLRPHPPDGYPPSGDHLKVLRATACLPATHALQAGAIAYQGELFAVLTGIAFIAFFFGFLTH